MLVKVLDENRVKILMEDQDIAHYDLPFDRFSDDDPKSRAFIYELIIKAKEETGVDFHDCRVMIEVIPGVAQAYYILLTRIKEEGDQKIQFDKAEIAEREMYIYKLNHARNIPPFFSLMKAYPPEKSLLYYWNDQYYAVLYFAPLSTNDLLFNRLLISLDEYAGRCRYRYINDALLKEWGDCLSAGDAYESFICE